MTYSNGLIVEALLAAGSHFADNNLVSQSLGLLEWLVEVEWSPEGHFSFTPTGGRDPDGQGGFDQQPLEAWTLADACALAFDLTGEVRWRSAVRWAAQWFIGANDQETPMWDPATGAAFDGLTATGVNTNQGAESTLAFIGTMLAYETTLAASTGSPRKRASR